MAGNMKKDRRPKFPTLEKYDSIQIIWIDSCEQYGWSDRDETIKVADVPILTTTNFLEYDNEILEDSDLIVTVRDIGGVQHGGLFAIPLDSIVDIRKLYEHQTKKEKVKSKQKVLDTMEE
ncbi:MAG: hypothetical protein KAS32_03295 [Candidatus Peribacteraceae bacterium]|nr:hypothetical protein [Candidatus Peribacteraceae bacterium]